VPILRRLARLSNCKEASRLISQAQEGQLPLGDWIRLRLHIYWCVACQLVERQIRLMRQAMRRYRD